MILTTAMKKILITLVTVVLFCAAAHSSFAIPVTFRNNSVESINLFIPGLPNPTLAPKTIMGADLAKGQRIFFTHEGTQYLLLTVSEEMENKRVDICSLIKERINQIEALQ